MPLTEDELYDLLAAVDASHVDGSVVEATEALVLDHLACGLFAMELPWTLQVRRVVERETPPATTSTHPASGGGARLYGHGTRVPESAAALINGTAGHGFDLDDLHYPTMTHPGAVILAGALAVADETRADGPHFLAAVAAGYEAMARLSRAVGLQAGRLGFHGTSVQGPAGAAVAVATLLGADRRQIANAVGIAASFGSGIKSFQHGPGAVKRLHAGRAAQGGVLAGRLAMEGFVGPDRAITGPFGFARVYGLGEHGTGPLDLGERDDPWAVTEIYIKPYAACGALHGLIRAGEDLAAGLEGPSSVRRVVLGAPRRVLEQNDIADPEDILTAQYSAQFAVAAGLTGRARDPAVFNLEGPPDEDLRQWMALMEFEVDEDAEAAYPDANQGRVSVHFSDRDVRSSFGSMSSTESQGWDVAVGKFREVTARIVAETVADSLVEQVRGLHDGVSPAALLDTLANTLDDDSMSDVPEAS